MNPSDVQSLVSTVDELIFSHTGEHLDDLQQAILEGAFDHQKYAEIAKKNHRSEKYIKDLAAKLWQTISAALGEEVSKSNIKAALQRYCFNLYHNNVVNGVQINRGNICNKLPENELKQSEVYQQLSYQPRYFAIDILNRTAIIHTLKLHLISQFIYLFPPNPRLLASITFNFLLVLVNENILF